MSDLTARVQMLIHKPPEEVFNAFADPRIVEKFWLKHASGPLAKNAVVEWEFMVEGARDTVTVTEFSPPGRIIFKWTDGIVVQLKFEPFDAQSTRFSVTATGFQGEDAVAQVVNATEGFTIVACDLKCLLEAGRSGNMARDKAALIMWDMGEKDA